jgi:hypothetical protein
MPAGGGDMDNKGTELPANRLMYDECIQVKSSGHRMWKCTCEGFQSMPEAVPLSVQLKLVCAFIITQN